MTYSETKNKFFDIENVKTVLYVDKQSIGDNKLISTTSKKIKEKFNRH